MKIAIVGDVQGHFNTMYEQAQDLGADVIIQLGDTCIAHDLTHKQPSGYPHKYADPAEFNEFLTGRRHIPIETYFIQGNHENFDFLEQHSTGAVNEIVDGLKYVPNGNVFNVGDISFGVLGGVYSHTYTNRDIVNGNKRKYFTQAQLQQLTEQDFDVLLTHHGPRSDKLGSIGNGHFMSPLTSALIREKSPTHAYHGHHNLAYETKIDSTKVIGLADVVSGKTSMVLHPVGTAKDYKPETTPLEHATSLSGM